MTRLITPSITAALIGAMTLLTACGPTPAVASIADHVILVGTIRQAGVSIELNSDVCQQFPIYGAYFHKQARLVLCSKGSTEEKLDTLRHEAWHLVQDLQDCDLLDDGLKPYGQIPKEAIDHFRRISGGNYEEKDLATEVEAYAAAETLSAKDITSYIRTLIASCNANNR